MRVKNPTNGFRASENADVETMNFDKKGGRKQAEYGARDGVGSYLDWRCGRAAAALLGWRPRASRVMRARV